MSLDIKSDLVMIGSSADLPYINKGFTAHRARKLVYRAGPARKVQIVVPSAPLPNPQNAVIRTLRPTIRRLNASLNVLTANGWGESGDTRADLKATKAEDAEICHTGNRTSEDHPRKALRPTEKDDKSSEDKLCENDGPMIVRTHRALRAADFEDSDDEDSFSGGTRGFNLEASTRWSQCNNRLKNTQGRQLTTIQLRIEENMLREIAQQALKAGENGENASTINSQGVSEEDLVLEIVLQLMELGLIDAGEMQGEEGGDIQMMVRNSLATLLGKARRPFRPSGMRVVEAELFQCLEAFRQMRLKLLQSDPGMGMAEILQGRSLDLRFR